ncbi:MAG TPA: SRPBCC family protein [Ilumatobacteraceae bacterium]|nr:SRPBCC family protein [Ilumatobacteraceae bacterium]
MAESASETTTIAASRDRIWEIVTDVERYPDWARDIKDVTVHLRDDEGRPLEVEFRASALGRSTHYTLRYDYSQAPDKLAWSLLRGDIMRTSDGSYVFRDTDAGGTQVRYDLVIELAIPLPGFVKRRAEVRILHTLRELKDRAES